jgi:hypothetical protein
MGRSWAERVTGPKAAHWTRPTWPRREKSSKPPRTSGYGPVHAVGLHGGPTGRVTLEAQRPFTQPQPGKGGLAPPKGARRAGRRRSLPTVIGGGGVLGSRWGALRPDRASSLSCKDNTWSEGLLPREGGHARDTARCACALGSAGGEAVAMARVGAAGQLSRAQAPAAKRSRHEGRFTAKRSTPPRRLAQRRDAAWLSPLHTGRRGSLTSTGNRWLARPDLGAEVRRLRHRVLPVAQTNTAPRPRPRT